MKKNIFLIFISISNYIYPYTKNSNSFAKSKNNKKTGFIKIADKV